MNKRILELALAGLQAERSKIEEEISDVKKQLNGHAAAPTSGRSVQASLKGQTQKGGLTPAGRKKLADAMRRRWAAKRKASKKK